MAQFSSVIDDARKLTQTDPHMFELSLGEAGEAPELVFLHGWGHSHESFLALARAFKGEHLCRLYDLPGFGQTPMLEVGAGTAGYARHLAAQLKTEADRGRVIIGHSFGCRVAIRFARAWPDQVDALILISAAGLKRKRSVGFRLRAMLLRWLGKFCGAVDWAFGTKYRDAYREKFGSRDYRRASDLRETFVATVTEDLSELAGEVKCPVLLIYGADDTETPVELGERYERLIPNATLKVLPHFGHLDILSAGRQQVATLIKRFLGK